MAQKDACERSCVSATASLYRDARMYVYNVVIGITHVMRTIILNFFMRGIDFLSIYEQQLVYNPHKYASLNRYALCILTTWLCMTDCKSRSQSGDHEGCK